MIRFSYSRARQQLASLWDRIENESEVAILRRRGHRDLALLEADEYEALRETAHLLSSPRNALRLLDSLEEVREGRAQALTFAEARAQLGSERDADD